MSGVCAACRVPLSKLPCGTLPGCSLYQHHPGLPLHPRANCVLCALSVYIACLTAIVGAFGVGEKYAWQRRRGAVGEDMEGVMWSWRRGGGEGGGLEDGDIEECATFMFFSRSFFSIVCDRVYRSVGDLRPALHGDKSILLCLICDRRDRYSQFLFSRLWR